MDYSKLIADVGPAIDASKLLATIDTTMLADFDMAIDVTKFLATIDTAQAFAAIDTAALFANVDTARMLKRIDATRWITTVDASRLLGGIDTARLFAKIDATKVFADVASVSRSAEVASEILESEELADAVASAEVSETDEIEGPVAVGIPADLVRGADPFGLVTRHRELTNGEWSLLQLIAGAVGVIALTSYHRTAEESAAASIIAFYVLPAVMSSRSTPWT